MDRVHGDHEMEASRTTKRVNELVSMNSQMAAHVSGLEGQIEEMSSQRDQILARMPVSSNAPRLKIKRTFS